MSRVKKTVQALVYPRVSGLKLTATAVVGACSVASFIGTYHIRSGGVTVLARRTACGFAAAAGFGASGAVGPAMVSVRCVANGKTAKMSS